MKSPHQGSWVWQTPPSRDETEMKRHKMHTYETPACSHCTASVHYSASVDKTERQGAHLKHGSAESKKKNTKSSHAEREYVNTPSSHWGQAQKSASLGQRLDWRRTMIAGRRSNRNDGEKCSAGARRHPFCRISKGSLCIHFYNSFSGIITTGGRRRCEAGRRGIEPSSSPGHQATDSAEFSWGDIVYGGYRLATSVVVLGCRKFAIGGAPRWRLEAADKVAFLWNWTWHATTTEGWDR